MHQPQRLLSPWEVQVSRVVLPAMRRWLDAEDAHRFAVWAAANGLSNTDTSTAGAAVQQLLQTKVRGWDDGVLRAQAVGCGVLYCDVLG
jgi:hypothetical protein